MNKNPDSPIGVFDSGLGGLTVLRALMRRFPNESFVYLGDTARIPYGSKSPATIARYSERNIRFLMEREVKAVVVACNSASSVLDVIEVPRPVYNVIEPGAQAAVNATQAKKVGIIGTRATVMQKAYVRAIEKLNPAIEVLQQACPLLVPLVEEGWNDDPITNLIVYRYLSPLLSAGVDTVVMGCTHYPILTNAIRKVTGSAVHLVDSAEVLADRLEQEFATGRLPATRRVSGRGLQLLVTDVSDAFHALASRILGVDPMPPLEIVDIS